MLKRETFRSATQKSNRSFSTLCSPTKPVRFTYIFPVAAAIFLPLSFLTGLMGKNIGGMPGVDNGGAFCFFAGLCLAIIVMQVTLFRRLKWF
jgi:Mg2+ and Co2+ transporter CorA